MCANSHSHLYSGAQIIFSLLNNYVQLHTSTSIFLCFLLFLFPTFPRESLVFGISARLRCTVPVLGHRTLNYNESSHHHSTTLLSIAEINNVRHIVGYSFLPVCDLLWFRCEAQRKHELKFANGTKQ